MNWKSNSILFIVLQTLNMFDALMTMTYIALGAATEKNPIMRAALDVGPWCFLLIKLILVGGAGALLIRLNARRALMAMVVVYAVLACYHVAGGLAR